jgi:hypothetical protein
MQGLFGDKTMGINVPIAQRIVHVFTFSNLKREFSNAQTWERWSATDA